jgi:uncharacterized protein (DUF433 family)
MSGFFPEGAEQADFENVVSQTRPQQALLEHLLGATTHNGSSGEAERANITFLATKLENSPASVRTAIVIEPRVMHGNPVFQGTRVSVYQIIEELADGTRLEELPECFPSLNHQTIQAGLDFAIRLLRIYDD